MTLAGRFISLFPAIYLTIFALLLFLSQYFHQPLFLLAGIAHIYLTPLFLFRLHEIFFPLAEGDFDLAAKTYNPWWTSYMLQYPFIAFPWLEAVFHFFPGLFSIWIRSWGGKVGKGVLWTPRVEILDRALIEIGDGVVIGHMSIFCSHAISAIEGKPVLRIKTIKVGNKSLIGGDSQLGPGAVVPAGQMLPAKSRVYWKGAWQV